MSKSMDLNLAPGILEEVIEDAKKWRPQEACGLIAGVRPSSGRRLIPMENVKASETEYEMDPSRLIGVLRGLRNSGEELVAIYHSHPFGPARPSRSDIERAYYPEAVQLIVSLADPERPHAAAFRIVEGEVLEVELRVIV